MNIFALSQCPRESAQWQHDRHVVKMILESAQMLSTALDAATDYVANGATHRYGNPKYPHTLLTLDGVVRRWDSGLGPSGWSEFRFGLPKPTHVNHPCNLWLRESIHNFAWLAHHALALCNEYNYRFGKTHVYTDAIFTCVRLADLAGAAHSLHTPHACAMPEMIQLNCKGKFDNAHEDSIWAYRIYYVTEKLVFGQPDKREYARWTRRGMPQFIRDMSCNFRFPDKYRQPAYNCVVRNMPSTPKPGLANPFGRYHAKNR